MMHVLLIEINLNGHHPVYLEKIARRLLTAGKFVTVAVSDRYANHDALLGLIEEHTEHFSVVPIHSLECDAALNSSRGDTHREIRLRKIIRSAFLKSKELYRIDFVFLPYADYCLNAIGLMGSPFGETPWGAICMRPSFHLNDSGVVAPFSSIQWLKKILFIRSIRQSTLKKIFSIDRLLVESLLSERPALNGKISYLPDPVDPPMAIDNGRTRSIYNIPADVPLILVYGAIDERKGIFRLLDTLEIDVGLDDWHVLVVGRQSDAVSSQMLTDRWKRLKQEGRLHTINKYVESNIENDVFGICDVVWAGYIGHYTMSNVIVRAGFFKKPVLACENGLIGWYAKQKGIGRCIGATPHSLAHAIDNLRTSSISKDCGERGAIEFKNNNWNYVLDSVLFDEYGNFS